MQPQDIAVHIGSMKERFAELEKQLAAPDIYSRPAECKALSRERQYLAGIFESYEAWNRTLEEIRGNRELLAQEKDPEFLALLEADLEELEKRSAQIEQRLTIALIPRDAADSRDTIVEIRPAAGGEEAALFAGEMFRMYLKFAEKNGWRSEVLEQSDSDLGGIKEAVFSLSGNDVFSLMKFESGVHRVQRVPATESAAAFTHPPSRFPFCPKRRRPTRSRSGMRTLRFPRSVHPVPADRMSTVPIPPCGFCTSRAGSWLRVSRSGRKSATVRLLSVF